MPPGEPFESEPALNPDLEPAMSDLARIGSLLVAVGFLMRAKGTWGATWTSWGDLIFGAIGILVFFVS